MIPFADCRPSLRATPKLQHFPQRVTRATAGATCFARLQRPSLHHDNALKWRLDLKKKIENIEKCNPCCCLGKRGDTHRLRTCGQNYLASPQRRKTKCFLFVHTNHTKTNPCAISCCGLLRQGIDASDKTKLSNIHQFAFGKYCRLRGNGHIQSRLSDMAMAIASKIHFWRFETRFNVVLE